MAGSTRKPGDAGKGKQDFDDVWDALVDRAGDDRRGATGDEGPTRDGAHDATEPPSTSSRTRETASERPDASIGSETPPSSGTKVWDEAARAAGLRTPAREVESVTATPRTAATKPWDDAARAIAAPEGEPRAARSADDMKMDALMAEAEAAKARREKDDLESVASPVPAKRRRATTAPWQERSGEWLERSDEEMERIMNAERLSAERDDAGDGKARRVEEGAVDARKEVPARDGGELEDDPHDDASADADAGRTASSGRSRARDDERDADADAGEAGATRARAQGVNRAGTQGVAPTQGQVASGEKAGTAREEDTGRGAETRAPDDEARDEARAPIDDADEPDSGGTPAGDGARSRSTPPEAGAGRGRIWILLVVILSLFGLWRLMPERRDREVVPTLDADRPAVPVGPAAEHPGGPPQPGPRSPDGSPMMEQPPAPPAQGEGAGLEQEQPESPAAEPSSDTPSSDEAETPQPAEEKAPEPRAEADVREPPPGVEPEHAAAFRRLPVGPGDGPPVGGVGEGGVHVDHIALGSSYGREGCGGKLDDFSVSERDRVNVCLRVVHPREKEEVVVLWQKDGKTIRRGKLSIPEQHAYRTRAYLMLREPYVGAWVVRILSGAGVELASHEFTVVP